MVLLAKCAQLHLFSSPYGRTIIKTLLDWVFKITNMWEGFHNSINLITLFLLRNSFPKKVIERNIKEFLNKKLSNRMEE